MEISRCDIAISRFLRTITQRNIAMEVEIEVSNLLGYMPVALMKTQKQYNKLSKTHLNLNKTVQVEIAV